MLGLEWDYQTINHIIEIERNKSMLFLHKALKGDWYLCIRLGSILYTKKHIINFIGNKSLIGGILPKIIPFIWNYIYEESLQRGYLNERLYY